MRADQLPVIYYPAGDGEGNLTPIRPGGGLVLMHPILCVTGVSGSLGGAAIRSSGTTVVTTQSALRGMAAKAAFRRVVSGVLRAAAAVLTAVRAAATGRPLRLGGGGQQAVAAVPRRPTASGAQDCL